MSDPDPTRRFSSRVADYVRTRPSYPAAVLDVLRDETGFTPASVVADVGSGTGISTELFLRNGNVVYGVEPNVDMRAAAERLLAAYPNFHSVAGTAEAATLPDRGVDFVVAGQAFHWFDRPRTRAEFARILVPGGWVVLMWNTRRTGTPFLDGYEALLKTYGTDYSTVRHDNLALADFAAFFAGPYSRRVVANEQRFDLAGLTGRLLSSSYAPQPGHPNHAPMLAELERLFAATSAGGEVVFGYDTEVNFGHV